MAERPSIPMGEIDWELYRLLFENTPTVRYRLVSTGLINVGEDQCNERMLFSVDSIVPSQHIEWLNGEFNAYQAQFYLYYNKHKKLQ